MKSFLPCYKRTAKKEYRGHSIEVVFYNPDYGVQVDGISFSSFYVDTSAALKHAEQYIDDLNKASNH